MFRPFDVLTAVVLCAGHFSFCVWAYNRLHAGVLPHPVVKVIDRIAAVCSLALFAGYLAFWARTGMLVAPWDSADLFGIWLRVHAALCLFAVIAVFPAWIWPRLTFRQTPALAGNHSTVIDLGEHLPEKPVHGARSRLYARLPGNQILKLGIHEKELRLPNWPAELDGFSLVHLSDLHMTGKLTRPFYEEVCREAQKLNGDLIVATGDIAEEAECLPWIAETFGRLRGNLGQMFILGNHELRLPQPALLRQALVDAGWEDLGGRRREVQFNGRSICLAGSERPWFGVEPPECPATSAAKILLAHTPDLFGWAQRRRFDLMLAGHTHGGQIRLPLIGPLIAPSRFGFRYASGVFEEGPTVMHVSRGLSGEHLLRFNCPPELAKLVIRRQGETR